MFCDMHAKQTAVSTCAVCTACSAVPALHPVSRSAVHAEKCCTYMPSSAHLLMFVAQANALYAKSLLGALVSCLSIRRDVRGSKVSGMILTTFGKVVETASVNRRLPRSYLPILQGWNRYRCDCLTMAALPLFHQRDCPSLLTLGGHCCRHPLAIIAASVRLLSCLYICCCSASCEHTTALAVHLHSRSTCFAGARDCSSASISFMEWYLYELSCTPPESYANARGTEMQHNWCSGVCGRKTSQRSMHR